MIEDGLTTLCPFCQGDRKDCLGNRCPNCRGSGLVPLETDCSGTYGARMLCDDCGGRGTDYGDTCLRCGGYGHYSVAA